MNQRLLTTMFVLKESLANPQYSLSLQNCLSLCYNAYNNWKVCLTFIRSKPVTTVETKKARRKECSCLPCYRPHPHPLAPKDENIGFDGYISTWILPIYRIYRRYIGHRRYRVEHHRYRIYRRYIDAYIRYFHPCLLLVLVFSPFLFSKHAGVRTTRSIGWIKAFGSAINVKSESFFHNPKRRC